MATPSRASPRRPSPTSSSSSESRPPDIGGVGQVLAQSSFGGFWGKNGDGVRTQCRPGVSVADVGAADASVAAQQDLPRQRCSFRSPASGQSDLGVIGGKSTAWRSSGRAKLSTARRADSRGDPGSPGKAGTRICRSRSTVGRGDPKAGRARSSGERIRVGLDRARVDPNRARADRQVERTERPGKLLGRLNLGQTSNVFRQANQGRKRLFGHGSPVGCESFQHGYQRRQELGIGMGCGASRVESSPRELPGGLVEQAHPDPGVHEQIPLLGIRRMLAEVCAKRAG